jgi:hypothetical protein
LTKNIFSQQRAVEGKVVKLKKLNYFTIPLKTSTHSEAYADADARVKSSARNSRGTDEEVNEKHFN